MPDTLAEFSLDGWIVDPARGRLLERDSRRVVPVRPKSEASKPADGPLKMR